MTYGILNFDYTRIFGIGCQLNYVQPIRVALFTREVELSV